MKTIIYDYGMNGEGVAKVDGVVTLVPYALNNEEVEIEIVKNYGNYNVANLKNVIDESKNRQIPPCPYFKTCGGCDLHHMSYSEQLKFKCLLVKKTIKKIANIDFDVSNTIPSDEIFEYRNKVSFNIKNNISGFYEQNTNNVVEIKHCMLTTNNINKIHNFFKNFLSNIKKDIIKHLVIREIDNQILVGVVTKEDLDLSTFYTLLVENFENIGLYKIINTRKDSVVISGKIIHVGGLKEIKVNNFGLFYYVDLEGFHQNNINIQNKIYKKVLEYISPNSVVINGFSGQGLLSAIIATKAKQVIGIEINKSSHLSAEKLKKDNNIKNLKNVLGDFNKKFKTFLSTADTVILDPSKKGCGKEVMKNLIGIKNILYISCNPIALAKDLKEIKDYYTIDEITPFDMFPNTKNVETFVKLIKSNTI